MALSDSGTLEIATRLKDTSKVKATTFGSKIVTTFAPDSDPKVAAALGITTGKLAGTMPLRDLPAHLQEARIGEGDLWLLPDGNARITQSDAETLDVAPTGKYLGRISALVRDEDSVDAHTTTVNASLTPGEDLTANDTRVLGALGFKPASPRDSTLQLVTPIDVPRLYRAGD